MICIIDAPSDLGLRQTGVKGLPDALRAAGLLKGRQDVRYDGRLPVPLFDEHRDPASGVRNPEGIDTFSRRLAERVADALNRGEFPLVLGGDCSILLGPALALRRRGRYGLFFVDGHSDFYSPVSEPNGEVASMDLSIVTGRGPAELADLDGLRPLVLDQDVVVFGFRDAEDAARHGSPDVRRTEMHVVDLFALRRQGPAKAAREGIAALERQDIAGFWLHLDADVLNDEIMPAVDYRMPDGLWPDELTDVLTVALTSPLVVGMDVTIYNPALDDEEHTAADVLSESITRALAAIA